MSLSQLELIGLKMEIGKPNVKLVLKCCCPWPGRREDKLYSFFFNASYLNLKSGAIF